MTEWLNDSLVVGSFILLLSVILSKSSNRFGLPVLLLFLGIGMFASSQHILNINYENYDLTHSLSLVAICLVIFSGGIMTKSKDVKPVLRTGILLSSLGVILTTGLVGLFCYYLIDLPIYESLLIGAILSSTDAAAVFTVFRDKNSQVYRPIKSVLEFESGSNDPMAYFLVTCFLDLYLKRMSLDASLLMYFITNPIIGAIAGLGFYKAFKVINDKAELDFQGLYPALMIGFLFLTFSLTNKMGGNGFLAVYVFALKIGNAKIVHKNALINFFDGISWLAQIGMFIMLGILVKPERLSAIAPQATFVALFLIFMARPLSIFISMIGSNFDVKSKVLISWSGLKGATPIVFACLIASEVGSEATLIFDVVFFSVLISAIIQGMTIKPLAKKLGLVIDAIHDPDFPIDFEMLEKTKNGIKEITILDYDFACDKRIVDLSLPSGTQILFLKRCSSFIIPNGSTTFQSQDRVLLVTPEKSDMEMAENHLRYDMSKLSEKAA
ncbi:MAG: potassium/proton antiporter [Oligoflexia bacterium]|nr:potassium/proton antiporter [Oligoflexia bacterium]